MPLPPTLGTSINPTQPPTLRRYWPTLSPIVIPDFSTAGRLRDGLYMAVDEIGETFEERVVEAGTLRARTHFNSDGFSYERHGPAGLQSPANGFALECYHRGGARAERRTYRDNVPQLVELFDPDGTLTETYEYDHGTLMRCVETRALHRWMMAPDATLTTHPNIPATPPSWYNQDVHDLLHTQFPADPAVPFPLDLRAPARPRLTLVPFRQT